MNLAGDHAVPGTNNTNTMTESNNTPETEEQKVITLFASVDTSERIRNGLAPTLESLVTLTLDLTQFTPEQREVLARIYTNKPKSRPEHVALKIGTKEELIELLDSTAQQDREKKEKYEHNLSELLAKIENKEPHGEHHIYRLAHRNEDGTVSFSTSDFRPSNHEKDVGVADFTALLPVRGEWWPDYGVPRKDMEEVTKTPQYNTYVEHLKTANAATAQTVEPQALADLERREKERAEKDQERQKQETELEELRHWASRQDNNPILANRALLNLNWETLARNTKADAWLGQLYPHVRAAVDEISYGWSSEGCDYKEWTEEEPPYDEQHPSTEAMSILLAARKDKEENGCTEFEFRYELHRHDGTGKLQEFIVAKTEVYGEEVELFCWIK